MNIDDAQLRVLQKADLDLILEWRNSERIRQAMFSDAIISKEDHYNWFNSLAKDNAIYLIFEFQGQPVGVSNFKAIDPVHSRCLWGFYLGETNLPHGLGLVLGVHSLDYAFQRINIKKLCSEVLANNPISLSYHLRLGFALEGVLKRHVKKGSGILDVFSLAQFQEDWEIYRPMIINDIKNKY